jgi:hypothetical protein
MVILLFIVRRQPERQNSDGPVSQQTDTLERKIKDKNLLYMNCIRFCL